ncbi:hypothetical protein KCU62_g124, partial [Aureobasidium sp. EXF-3399]
MRQRHLEQISRSRRWFECFFAVIDGPFKLLCCDKQFTEEGVYAYQYDIVLSTFLRCENVVSAQNNQLNSSWMDEAKETTKDNVSKKKMERLEKKRNKPSNSAPSTPLLAIHLPVA